MSQITINRGDVYLVNPNPTAGHETRGNHRYVAITTKEMNRLGVATTVPITSGGNFAREAGFTVAITGHDTTGVALCHEMRSFDINARVKAGTAKYIETLDQSIMNEIIDRVVSIIDPAE